MKSKDLDLEKELQKIKDKLKYPCIAILGRAGSGKSTLIKEIFDIQIPSGAGKSITTEFKKYPVTAREDKPIFLYDSPGYEADNTKAFLQKTINFLQQHSLKELKDDLSSDNNIHLVWYLIGTKRLENFDETVIKTVIEQGIPLIIVVTQIDIFKKEELNALRNAIRKYLDLLKEDFKRGKPLNIEKTLDIKILEVTASPIYEHKTEEDQKKLQQLVDTSIELLPTIYRDAFIYAQEKNIQAKRRLAWLFIGGAATAVFGTSFVPVPGSTPVMTITTQNTLLKELEKIYNFHDYSNELIQLVQNLDEKLLVLVAGLVIDVASLAMGTLFPGLFLAGESIAGSIAASYILALGFAYAATLEDTALKYLNSDNGREEIIQFLKERFQENFNKFSKINLKNKEDIEKLGKDFLEG